MRTRFGAFTLDPATRQLLEDGRPIHLSPKAFDVLQVLIEARPTVVPKADLHDRIWPGTYVVDANLSVLIGEIRRALADSGAADIEDLGSTNGTFVNETRVESPVPLRDGDLLHLGTVPLTFRAWLPERSRSTERIRRAGGTARRPQSAE